MDFIISSAASSWNEIWSKLYSCRNSSVYFPKSQRTEKMAEKEKGELLSFHFIHDMDTVTFRNFGRCDYIRKRILVWSLDMKGENMLCTTQNAPQQTVFPNFHSIGQIYQWVILLTGHSRKTMIEHVCHCVHCSVFSVNSHLSHSETDIFSIIV